MVAKSFQSLEQIGEPYTVSGRQYVKVRTKTGTIRQVRWYTEKEYRAMYPTAEKTFFKPQREVLGFGEKGYITIFKGHQYPFEEYYFRTVSAHYTRWWGWYIASSDEVPSNLPSDITPVRLYWDLVGKSDGSLLNEDKVIEAVESIIYDADDSEYQGKVGERLERVLTVEQTVLTDSPHGTVSTHIMRDEANNCYVWNTTAQSWAVGSTHNITGTIKELKSHHGTKRTVLTRCRETLKKH